MWWHNRLNNEKISMYFEMRLQYEDYTWKNLDYEFCYGIYRFLKNAILLKC